MSRQFNAWLHADLKELFAYDKSFQTLTADQVELWWRSLSVEDKLAYELQMEYPLAIDTPPYRGKWIDD